MLSQLIYGGIQSALETYEEQHLEISRPLVIEVENTALVPGDTRSIILLLSDTRFASPPPPPVNIISYFPNYSYEALCGYIANNPMRIGKVRVLPLFGEPLSTYSVFTLIDGDSVRVGEVNGKSQTILKKLDQAQGINAAEVYTDFLLDGFNVFNFDLPMSVFSKVRYYFYPFKQIKQSEWMEHGVCSVDRSVIPNNLLTFQAEFVK